MTGLWWAWHLFGWNSGFFSALFGHQLVVTWCCLLGLAPSPTATATCNGIRGFLRRGPFLTPSLSASQVHELSRPFWWILAFIWRVFLIYITGIKSLLCPRHWLDVETPQNRVWGFDFISKKAEEERAPVWSAQVHTHSQRKGVGGWKD